MEDNDHVEIIVPFLLGIRLGFRLGIGFWLLRIGRLLFRFILLLFIRRLVELLFLRFLFYRLQCLAGRLLEPAIPLEDYIYTEGRYKMLRQSDPQSAAALLEAAQQDVRTRWETYAEMAEKS